MSDVSPSGESLRERIAAWSAEHAAEFPEEVRELFAHKTEEVVRSGILEASLAEGESAPSFSLRDSGGNTVSLENALERGPVILSFYRGTWCPFCNLEFLSLLETMPKFRELDASLFAISPQVADRREDPGVSGFFDLSDPGNRVAREFGLVYPLGREIIGVYEKFGIRLDHLNGEQSGEVPIPATFVIAPDLMIRYAHADADITERAEPNAVLNILSLMAG